MIVRQISLLSAAAFLFVAMLGPMNVAAQDYDGDGTIDSADPCPHIAGAAAELMSAPRVILDYAGTGPGGGDDALRIFKLGAFFITLAPYDPKSVDNVHLTLRRTTTTGPGLFETTLAAGPAQWSQKPISSKGHQQWDYSGPAPGVGLFKGFLRNALVGPVGSGLQRLTVKKAHDTNIAGPLGPDDVVTILEIESTVVPFTGLCFFATSGTCTSSGGRDDCLP